MKTQMKGMSVVVTLLFALTMMAQTATTTDPAAPAATSGQAGEAASKCPCCGQNMAKMKAGAKCPMMANSQSCCAGRGGCCQGGTCKMNAKDGESCCENCAMMSGQGGSAGGRGGQCWMMNGGKSAANSCCRHGAACCGHGQSCCGKKTAA